MTFTRLWSLAVVVGLAMPGITRAQDTGQRRPIELGIDAALARESGDRDKVTTLALPVSRFRVGFFLSDALSLEPSIAVNYTRITVESSFSGEKITSSGTSYDFDVGLLYHFATDRTKSQVYVRPFLGIRGFSNSSEANDYDDSGSQVSFGGALGFKFPAMSRVGTRIEAGYSHHSENEPDFEATNRIFLSFGLSFFTR